MSWLQVRLAIQPKQAAQWEDSLFELGAISVSFMDAEDQPIYEPDLGTTPLWTHTHLLALFEGDVDPQVLHQHLQLLGGAQTPELQMEKINDQDWERNWMVNFQPMKFGQRLWIIPSWHTPPEPDAVNVILDPGLAFGTGTHATTALCLEWLSNQPIEGCNVLDFGCGSGILAIAAKLLGAAQLTCTDIDSQALEATRDNANRNGIAEQDLLVYLPENMPQQQFDVVLANILAGPLVELAPQLINYTRPGGRIALSGILAEQAQEVRDAYSQHFDLAPTVDKDGWVCISGVRH